MPDFRKSGGWLWFAAGLLFFGGCVSQADYDRLLRQNEALRLALRSAEERIAALEKPPADPAGKKPGSAD